MNTFIPIHARRLTLRTLLRAGAVFFALFAGGHVHGSTWQATSGGSPTGGDWFTAGNWTEGVPNSSDYTYINQTGTSSVLIGSGTAYSGWLQMANTGTARLTIGSGARLMVGSSGFSIASGTGSKGALSVEGGRLDVSNGNLSVGYLGSGTMSLSQSAQVNAYYISVGAYSASSTSRVVLSLSSTLNANELYVGSGSGGTAFLEANGASTLTTGYATISTSGGGSQATANLSGSARWTVTQKLQIGTSGGSGTLNISDYAKLAISSFTPVYIGSDVGTSGTVAITNNGIWDGGDVYIGNNGQGALVISTGGTMRTDAATFGYYFSTASGSATVSGGGRWSSGAMTFNRGSLNILNGGIVDSSSAYMGESSGFGTASVSGTGSLWNISGRLVLGTSNSGTGNLLVTSGGAVSAGEVEIGGNGVASVSGTGSRLDAKFLDVGQGSQSGALLLVQNGGALNSGTAVIGVGSGGAVTVSGAGSVWTNTNSIAVGLSNTGTLVVQNGGVVAAGSITKSVNTSSIILDAGTLRALGDHAAFLGGSGTSAVQVGAGGATIDSNGFAIGISSSLSGSGALIKQGAGSLTLAGNNAYGNTTISSGTLIVGSGTTGTLGTGSVLNNSALAFGRTDAVTVANVISGSGVVQQGASGTLTLTGSNSHTGGTVVRAGTVNFSSDANLGALGGTLTLDGGTLHNTTSIFDLGRQITLGPGGGTIELGSGGLTLTQAITGSGGLTKTAGNILTLTGAQTYTGSTRVQGGMLKVEAGSLASSGVDIATGATLNFSNGGGTFAGALTGSGLFQRSGTGTLTLTGNSAFSGTTSVESGVLRLTGGSLGTDETPSLNLQVAGGSGQTASLVVAGGKAYNYNATVGGGAGSLGSATVSSGTWVNKAPLTIGGSGTGSLAITGGYVSSIVTILGNNAGGVGIATVSSGTWVNSIDLVVGGSGTGSLLLTGGLISNVGTDYIGGFSLGTGYGTATVSSGTWNFNMLNITNGVLNLTDSGVMNGGLISVYNGAVNIGTGGTAGRLTGNLFSGTAGAINFNHTGTVIYAGAIQGTPTVKVQGGGTTILTGSSAVSGTTTITNNSTLQIGNGVTGAVYGTAMESTNSLQVGDTGGRTGTFGLIGARATTYDAWIGSGTGSRGEALVSSGTWNVVDLHVGASGIGELTVLNSYVRSAARTILGETAGGRGTLVLVSSTFVAVAPLTIGESGSGDFSASNSYIEDQNIDIGKNAGSSGFLTLGNSTLSTSTLVVGGAGSGSLSISGSSVVNSILTTLGSQASGGGTATISGGTWNSGGPMYVGGSGIGFLSISHGSVSSAVTILGNNEGSMGTATMAGGTWTNTTNLVVGGSGTGSLLLVGGLISNAGSDYIGGVTAGTGYGTATVYSGTWNFNSLNITNGVLTIADSGVMNGSRIEVGAGEINIGVGGAAGRLVADVYGGTGSVVNFNHAGTSVFAGNISGISNLNVKGSGLSILLGSNSNIGIARLTSGTLQLASSSALGTSGTVQMAGGVLQFSSNNTADLSDRFDSAAGQQYRIDTNGQSVTFASSLTSSSGSLEKFGGGTLTLTGSNTYSGQTIIRQGVLQVGNGGASGSLGTGNVVNNSQLVFNRSGSLAQTGVIRGTGSLEKLGSGILSLTGSNSYTGGTTVRAGAIHFGSDANLGALGSTVTLDGGTLHNINDLISSRQIILGANGGTIENGSGYLTLTSAITGSGALTKTNANILTLTGVQTYTGATTVQAGTLKVEAGSLATSGVDLALGARLIFNNGGNYAGAISGSGTFARSGTGTTVYTGAASNSGGTVIEDGTLQVGNGGLGGSLGGGAITNNGLLAINRGGLASVSSVISGTGRVSVLGSGTVFFSGSSTYAGGTAIAAGTTKASNPYAMGTGTVTVDGGIFVVDASEVIANEVVLSGGEYQRVVTGNLAHAADATSDLGGHDTGAAILGGTSDTAATLVTSFSGNSSALNDSARISDVYSLVGTGTNTFVLQLRIDEVAADSYLGWLDTETNHWVNAVEGNTNGTMFFVGDSAYDPLTDFHLGYYGVDTASGTVWAVLNHNSDFAIVPEPTAVALLMLSGVALLARRQKGFKF